MRILFLTISEGISTRLALDTEMKRTHGFNRVELILRERGSEAEVVLLPKSTATAADAARAIGVNLSAIGKTIMFRGLVSGLQVAAVISGDKRVSEQALSACIREPVRKMSADEVQRNTSYPIGGVSPIGLPADVRVLVDSDLLDLAYCVVAAGHPRAVTRLATSELVELSRATVAQLSSTEQTLAEESRP